MLREQLDLFRPPPPPPPRFDHLFGDFDTGDAEGARWYQREAFDSNLAAWKGGARSVLNLIATGLGKSWVFAMHAKHERGPVLILSHRDELVDQAAKELSRVTGEDVEVEQAELRASAQARLVSGSVQSIYQKSRLERLGKKRFSLVVVDEAHHSIAESYRRVLDWFNCPVLGMTATADRGDELAMGQVYDEVSYVMDIQDGIEDGHLVRVVVDRVKIQSLDISGVKDLDDDAELDEATVRAVDGICQKVVELHPNRYAILFWPGVKCAEYAATRLNALRLDSAICISAKTDEFVREKLVADFKAKKYRYLSNVGIATEGFNAPHVDLIVLARPSKSRSLIAQQCGRGTRPLSGVVDPWPDKDQAEWRRAAIRASGKPELVVMDFEGVSGQWERFLCSPEDVLGGKYTRAEIAEAKARQRNRPGEDVLLSLAAARAALAERALLAKVRVVASVQRFDPFKDLGLENDQEQSIRVRFGGKPISQGQADALLKFGLRREELPGNSRMASRLLNQLISRANQGLASVRQLALLKEHGVTDQNLTRQRASVGIDYIKANPGIVDAGFLRELVLGRVVGEDG